MGEDQIISNEKKITTIRLEKGTIPLIRRFQKHPRESNEDIIKRLMDRTLKYLKLKKEGEIK